MKKSVLKGLYSLFMFVALVLLLCFFDRSVAGHTMHVVGLSSLNKFFFKFCGSHKIFDTLSDLLLLVSFAFPAFFGGVGFMQLLRRKSYLKVDRTLRSFIYFTVLLLVLYVFFDHFSLNVRPIFDKNGAIDPSFPSTHCLFTMFFSLAGITMMDALVEKKDGAVSVFKKVALVLPCLCGVFRLFAGVHWFTDVLGGLLLGYSLSQFHRAFTEYKA